MAKESGQEAWHRVAPALSAAGDAGPARGQSADPRPRPQAGDALFARDGDGPAGWYATSQGERERSSGNARSSDSPLSSTPASPGSSGSSSSGRRGPTNKIYVLHAPEVECIAKGNARTRYEFGVKMSIAVTNREPTAVSSSGASAPLPDCLMTAIR